MEPKIFEKKEKETMNKKKWANILLEQEDTEDLKSKSKEKNKIPQETAKK